MSTPSTESNLLEKLQSAQVLLNQGQPEKALSALNVNNFPVEFLPQILRMKIAAQRKLGRFAQAHAELMNLKQITPLNLTEKELLLDNYTKVNFHNNHDLILKDICVLLTDSALDSFKISGKVCDLILSAFPDLTSSNAPSLSHPLLSSDYFYPLLKVMPLPNRDIEFFLTHLRTQVLLNAIQQGEIPDALCELAISLAYQNHINEHVHYVTDDEKSLVADLETLLSTHIQVKEWQPSESEAILILLAMYKPVYLLLENLERPEDYSWPLRLQQLISDYLINWREQRNLGLTCKQLTPISQSTPIEVINQYHENPYPRWISCQKQSALSLGHVIQYLSPTAKFPKSAFNKNLSILVAGCGTGRQAIELSYLLPQAKITAFDLSRSSLGYAMFKAKELNRQSLRFYQGDILSLDTLHETFDYIECCGVLHHLPDPIAGWKQLLTKLKPNGVMRIDLYSRLARQDVIERKSHIAQLNLNHDIDTLRKFRRALLIQNSDKALLKFRDFYNASECRDLLFHSHEKQYSLAEIADILKELSLQFIGMHTDESRYALFNEKYSLKDAGNIYNWHELEQENPFMFAGMYSFWCSKK